VHHSPVHVPVVHHEPVHVPVVHHEPVHHPKTSFAPYVPYKSTYSMGPYCAPTHVDVVKTDVKEDHHVEEVVKVT
jgi:hypothetical protein